MKKIIILINLILTINILGQIKNKPNDTLPVEMVYFIGDVVDSVVEIRWGTATEVNNYGYDVLRADTSFIWEQIAFVQGHGNSFAPKDYLFQDTSITSNGYYFYLLKQIDFDGNFETTHDTVQIFVDYLTAVKNTNFETDKSFLLSQNFPNPFNPSTTITFSIPESDFVTIRLFTINGEAVETIFSGNVTAGTHRIIFRPNNLSSGTYIYKLNTKNKSFSKKMLFIK